MKLLVRPITRRNAQEFIRAQHRHSDPPIGDMFRTSIVYHGALVAVGIVGRPVARGLDDRDTVEILRVCTLGTRNACSLLYGRLCRAAEALGFQRAITYTRIDEDGASLRAAGFRQAATVKGREWTTPSRPRRAGRDIVDRVRWERELAP